MTTQQHCTNCHALHSAGPSSDFCSDECFNEWLSDGSPSYKLLPEGVLWVEHGILSYYDERHPEFVYHTISREDHDAAYDAQIASQLASYMAMRS